MLRDVMMWVSVAGAAYAWLCAIVAPLVTAARSCARERASRRALIGLALAAAAAVLWTIVPAAVILLGMLLEPRAGLALVQARGLGAALAAGAGAWLMRLAIERRMPRLGATFETATAIAIAAAVDDDDRTLAKVERVYRTVATEGAVRSRLPPADIRLQPMFQRALPVTAGSRNVKTAPPPGAFEARTSPPWRSTMARTIDSPSPLPDGAREPERDASTL